MVSSPPSPVVRGSWPSKEPSAFSQEPKLSCLHFLGQSMKERRRKKKRRKGKKRTIVKSITMKSIPPATKDDPL